MLKWREQLPCEGGGFKKRPRNQVKLPGPDKDVCEEEKTRCQEFSGPGNAVLQNYLAKGEYPPFKSPAMFESAFVQVSRKGKPVFFHNHGHEAIVGIAADDMKLPLPNMMFIARPVVMRLSRGPPKEELILTRLIPLRFVRLAIRDREKQIIEMILISGQSYYLLLHPSTKEKDNQFRCWCKLIHLLHHPPARYFRPKPISFTGIDHQSIPVIPRDEEAVQEEKEENNQEQKEKGQISAKTPHQSGFDIEEEYTADERHILEIGDVRTFSEWFLYENADSFETYAGSKTSVKPIRTFSSAPVLSELTFSNTSMNTSRSSGQPPAPPVFPVPKKGENGSLNIVTIYSAISKILGEKNGERADTEPCQRGVLEQEELRGQ
nr:protein FAM71F2-like [Pogona vitticeps]